MRIVNDSLTSFTDSTKRGDISSALIDPDPHTDYHMSSGGKGMVCADCHAASDHGFVGRRVDLRPNDVPARLTCTSCHEDRPHGDYDSRDGRARDTHAGHVACHSSLSDGPVRMDLQGEVGYELKGPASQVCRQCHGNKENMSFAKLHEKHVRDKRKDCSTCHNFSRPERGLSTSLNNPQSDSRLRQRQRQRRGQTHRQAFGGPKQSKEGATRKAQSLGPTGHPARGFYFGILQAG